MKCTTALAVLLLGCGDAPRPDEPDPDAGPSDDGGPGFSPTPPEPIATPILSPCPEGWRAVDSEAQPGIAVCEPWPESGRATCADDEAHFPGEPGCRRVGPPCPAGDFAEGLPVDGSVLYVLAGAVGGDGSPATPFGRIEDALAAAPAGATIAISKGTFDESVRITREVTLVGACVAETEIRPTTASDFVATIAVQSRSGATLRNLRISGPRPGIEARAASDPVRIESVIVSGASVAGLTAFEAARLVVDDVVIDGTTAAGDGNYGYGVDLEAGGMAELTRAVVSRNRGEGVFVQGAGSSFSASDLSIRDTAERESDGALGCGIEISAGAQADVERAVLEGNRSAALRVIDAESSLAATDLVVRDTLAQANDDASGYGLEAHGPVTLDRATFSRNLTLGIWVADPGASLDATDLVVEDTDVQPSDDDFGSGLFVSDGAHADLLRAAIGANRLLGIVVTREATFVARDLLVADTAPGGGEIGGFGLEVSRATVDLGRALLARNRGVGLLVAQSASGIASDLEVAETQTDASGHDGDGIQVGADSTMTITRARVRDNHRLGVQAIARGVLTIEDVVVQGTLAQSCADCPSFGTGLGVFDGARVVATRFRSSRNVLCGVQVAGGEMDLHEGEVSHNPIGANVQSPGFDVGRLQDGVVFVDNETTLDATLLPVPDPTPAIER